MRLIVASNNPGKLLELRELLPPHIELLTLSDAGLESPPETGATFVENALLKARAACHAADAALADDSGLEVDALQGAPGVLSARFAGHPASDEANNAKLIAALSRLPGASRAARFRSAVALVTRDGRAWVADGTVEGVIVDTPRGEHGFGYDPHFQIHDPGAPELDATTMAELPIAIKNTISHRARAYHALLSALQRHGIDLAHLDAGMQHE